jgi:transposase-like protein
VAVHETDAQVTSFYSALKAELDRHGAELERVDDTNWEAKLNGLYAEQGTWQKVADQLGTDRRTIERWRKGYQPRTRANGVKPPRQRVNPAGFIPKIRAAFAGRGKDRRAQVAAVDWRKLFIHGTIKWGPPDKPYERTERMSVGNYLSPRAIAGISAAYISRRQWDTQRAIDHAMSQDYLGFDAKLIDVQELHF